MSDVSCFWVTFYVFISMPTRCQSLRVVHGQIGGCPSPCIIKLHALLSCLMMVMIHFVINMNFWSCHIMLHSFSRQQKNTAISWIVKRVAVKAQGSNLFLSEFTLIYFLYCLNLIFIPSWKKKKKKHSTKSSSRLQCRSEDWLFSFQVFLVFSSTSRKYFRIVLKIYSGIFSPTFR